MKINEIMNKELVTINSDSTIIDACKRLYRHKIGSLLVLDEGELKGIITERDIISRVVILNKDPNTTTVEEIISKDIITINENADFEEAVKLMTLHNIKKIPVISDTNNLVGIITTTDIPKILNTVKN